MSPDQRKKVSHIELALTLCSNYLKVTEVFGALLLIIYIVNTLQNPLKPNTAVSLPFILCVSTNILTRWMLDQSQDVIISKLN